MKIVKIIALAIAILGFLLLWLHGNLIQPPYFKQAGNEVNPS